MNLYEFMSNFLKENFDIILKDSIEILNYKLAEEISKLLLSNYGSTLFHINLTSLKGSPREVYGDFDCSDNLLTSLKDGPQEIDGDFDCSGNKLTSLKGAPEKINGDFNCFYNQLTSLEGAPQEIGGSFDCWPGNDNLPKYKVDAYDAYLELSDSEKTPLTKNGHYYPTKEWENKFK